MTWKSATPALLALSIHSCCPERGLVAAQGDFSATLQTPEEKYKPPGVSSEDYAANYYQALFHWTHDPDLAVVLNRDKTKNPMQEGGVCDPVNGEVAPQDNLPYWMPRFYPKPVPAEVTSVTGIRFASVDWQPCGHKDIVICHGESHYDFHLYYVEQEELEAKDCAIEGTHQLICREDNVVDDADKFSKNHKFFELMQNNIPAALVSDDGTREELNFCVDPTSAIPGSGIHYGDRDETLKEWKAPVTIIGSYDCKITFFEPMLSWKWIADRVYGSEGWPRWDSKFLEYNEKKVKSLPVRWSVEVTESCKEAGRMAEGWSNEYDPSTPCEVSVTVVGEKCPEGSDGCKAMIEERICGQQESCLKQTGLSNNESMYKSPETTFKISPATDAPTPAPATPAPTESSMNTTPATGNTEATDAPTPAPTTTPAPTEAPAPANDTQAEDKNTTSNKTSEWKYGSDTHYFCNGHTIVYGVNDHQHDELCENKTDSTKDTLVSDEQKATDAPTDAPTAAATESPTDATTEQGSTSEDSEVNTSSSSAASSNSSSPTASSSTTSASSASTAVSTVNTVDLTFQAKVAPADFDEGAFVAAVAKAAGADASDVETTVVFNIAVGYQFSVAVTEDQAIAAVADSNGVANADVTITSLGNAGGSDPRLRRLSGTGNSVEATIKTEDKAKATSVQESNAGDAAAAALTTKLGELLGKPVEVTKTKEPEATVSVKTSITTTSATAAKSLADTKDTIGTAVASDLSLDVNVTAAITTETDIAEALEEAAGKADDSTSPGPDADTGSASRAAAYAVRAPGVVGLLAAHAYFF